MVCKSQAVPANDLLLFVCGPKIGERMIAVLYGFMDASNTHSGAKVWCLCGFLCDEGAILKLDRDWNAVLDKPTWPTRVKRFHAVECIHQYGEFENWRFADRLAIWGELIDVIIDVPMAALGSVVVIEDFAKLSPEELDLLRSEELGDPLALSVQYAFQKAITLTRNTSDSENIGIAFDDEEPARSQKCHELCNVYKGKFGFGKRLAGIGFVSSFKFAPLQAADLLAYGTYRYIMQRYPDFNESDFPVHPGFGRMLRGIATAGGAFDLDAMKNLSAKIREKQSSEGRKMVKDSLDVGKILDDFKKGEASSANRKGSLKIDAPFEEAMNKILRAKPEPKKRKEKNDKRS